MLNFRALWIIKRSFKRVSDSAIMFYVLDLACTRVHFHAIPLVKMRKMVFDIH